MLLLVALGLGHAPPTNMSRRSTEGDVRSVTCPTLGDGAIGVHCGGNVAEEFRIRTACAADVELLASILIDCVAEGASVSFMAPLARAKAQVFWDGVLHYHANGERIVLVAEDAVSGMIVGTVQVVLAMPENQPHRAEIAKMLVHPSARRRGLGTLLMQAAEAVARSAGRTLLVLDTATGGDAERLYRRLGWQPCGVIPGYALRPDGIPCDTTFFYRTLHE